MSIACRFVVASAVAFLMTACGDRSPTAESGSGSKSAAAPSGERTVSAAAPSAATSEVDTLLAKYLDEMDTLSGLFKKVQDEPSAREHGPEIKASANRLKGLADQMSGIDATKKGMAFAAHTQRFMKLQEEMTPELMRISMNPELAKHMGDAMKLPKVK